MRALPMGLVGLCPVVAYPTVLVVAACVIGAGVASALIQRGAARADFRQFK
jgi:hypothetical protein